MLMTAIAKIRHGYRAVDMLCVADRWKWQDYMRISGLFDKGKFASRLLSGDVGQLEGFVQIYTDLDEQIYARRENRNPSTASSLPRWNPPSATRG